MQEAKRQAIVEMARAGHWLSHIRKALDYPKTTIYRVYNSWKAGSSTAQKPQKPRKDKI